MVLLSVEDVTKHYRRGRREFLALRSVSIEVEDRELAVILGSRKSGRTTLLRVASGLERPDNGTVRFVGRVLSGPGAVLGREIAYCHTAFPRVEGERVVDHVALPLLARRCSKREGRRAAEWALERVSAVDCAAMEPHELNAVERVRVSIARGIAGGPRIVVVDDADTGMSSTQAGGVRALLSSLARDDGVSVLMSASDPTFVAGAERAYTLEAGRVRGEAQAPTAEVLPLRPQRFGADAGHGR
jgi:predicted ABC-type transport system involved in lysophospholipase L1 biosynthesis ATPase subunit